MTEQERMPSSFNVRVSATSLSAITSNFQWIAVADASSQTIKEIFFAARFCHLFRQFQFSQFFSFSLPYLLLHHFSRIPFASVRCQKRSVIFECTWSGEHCRSVDMHTAYINRNHKFDVFVVSIRWSRQEERAERCWCVWVVPITHFQLFSISEVNFICFAFLTLYLSLSSSLCLTFEAAVSATFIWQPVGVLHIFTIFRRR